MSEELQWCSRGCYVQRNEYLAKELRGERFFVSQFKSDFKDIQYDFKV